MDTRRLVFSVSGIIKSSLLPVAVLSWREHRRKKIAVTSSLPASRLSSAEEWQQSLKKNSVFVGLDNNDIYTARRDFSMLKSW